jgi:hypothetical protein
MNADLFRSGRPAISALALIVVWFVLPFAAIGLHGLLLPGRRYLQVTNLTFVAAAICAAVWMLVGAIPALLAVPQALGRILTVALVWSCLVGWYAGPVVMGILARPDAASSAEECTFVVSHLLKQVVEIEAATGAATGTRFMLARSRWVEIHGRAGSKPTPGKVVRGRHNLWFATFD